MAKTVLIALALLAGAAAQSAHAQTARAMNEQLDGCTKSTDAQSIVDGCTRILEVGILDTQGQENVYLKRAAGYFELGALDRAAEDFSAALRINPRNTWLLTMRGTTYRMLGQYDLALKDAEAGMAFGPNGGLYELRGTVRALQGDFAGAVADYTSALEFREPIAVRAETLGKRAASHLNLKAFTLASADANAALALDPGNADVLFLQAEIRHAQGDVNGAVTQASLLIDSLPQRDARLPGMLNQTCWWRAVAGIDLPAARRDCDRAISLNPRNANFVDSRGLVGLKQRRFEEARADYDAALRLDPAMAGAMFGKGIALMRLGKQQEGEAWLLRARAAKPDIDSTFASYGMAD